MWQVSVPTLLSWQEIVGSGKQTNFAQSNDTSMGNVPEHTYLTFNRGGSTATAWRLPDTYFVHNISSQQHSRPVSGKPSELKYCWQNSVVL